jgi:hypothetical protein
MNTLLAYLNFNGSHDMDLIVIFGFVIAVIVIQSVARWQRDRLWHETARVALEKGQPVPPLDDPRAWRKYRRWDRGRRCGPRGLVLIAVGLGLYFVHPDGIGRWWALPLFIGVAQLLVGLLSSFGGRDDRDDSQTPPR